MTSAWQKSPPSLALIMQNVNFIMSQFSKQSGWKEYPRENNTRARKVWEHAAQTRLGGEFWACDVVEHKTYLLLCERVCQYYSYRTWAVVFPNILREVSGNLLWFMFPHFICIISSQMICLWFMCYQSFLSIQLSLLPWLFTIIKFHNLFFQ